MQPPPRDTSATETVSQATSAYGTPEPQIEVRLPPGSHYRAHNAATLQLAAQAELATPVVERWIVRTSLNAESGGRVYLELDRGTAAEAARGMAVLRAVVG